MKNKNILKSDEKISFSEESDNSSLSASPSGQSQKLKLLIVDDDNEVHVMTKLVLSDFHFKQYTLDFYSAYSEAEAKELIKLHPDAACILLDVVMESADAGLKLVKFIREKEKNDKVRLILRTGQPGQAPENEIIASYDINDYKEKTELTSQKLFTTITTALRSYLHLVQLEEKTTEIEEKNLQLNDEIARRIVAESNLTKYNRSLEKMLENKSDRLKTAIRALHQKEKELENANQSAQIGAVSSATFSSFEFSSQEIKNNLETINQYRSDMTILLEKYNTLQEIISGHSGLSKFSAMVKNTKETICEIDDFKKDIDLNSILKKYPEIIDDSVKGIETISDAISDITLFISINNDDNKNLDINQILDQILKKLKEQFNDTVEVQTSYEKLPAMITSGKNLQKAFHEIILNAFEAVQPQGIVSITTQCIEPNLEIHIQDLGTGIPEENIQKVFMPYFTTGKADKKGLGLTFAKSVITNNKGRIKIESEKDKGTHVIVKFRISKTP